MAFLHLKTPWTRQPAGPFAVNTDLIGAVPRVVGVGGIIQAPTQATIYGTVSNTASYKGRGLTFSGADADSPGRRVEFADNALYDITGALTILCVFNKQTPPVRANRGLVAKWIGYDSGSVSQRSYTLAIDYQTHASNDYVSLSVSGNGSTVQSSGVSGVVANGYHSLIGRYKPNESVATFLDGSLYASNTTSIVSSLYNSTAPLWIGTQYSINATGASAYSLVGDIFAFAVIPLALPDALCCELTKNPWQLFRPLSRTLYFPLRRRNRLSLLSL